MTKSPLAGLRILILEDEILIAMDVEQLCRDYGASDTIIVSTLDDDMLNGELADRFDVAIVDLRLRGRSTKALARDLMARNVPFCFATGMYDDDIATEFPAVEVVIKPYEGPELVAAISRAATRNGTD